MKSTEDKVKNSLVDAAICLLFLPLFAIRLMGGRKSHKKKGGNHRRQFPPHIAKPPASYPLDRPRRSRPNGRN